jgi:hypothetical protein
VERSRLLKCFIAHFRELYGVLIEEDAFVGRRYLTNVTIGGRRRSHRQQLSDPVSVSNTAVPDNLAKPNAMFAY